MVWWYLLVQSHRDLWVGWFVDIVVLCCNIWLPFSCTLRFNSLLHRSVGIWLSHNYIHHYSPLTIVTSHGDILFGDIPFWWFTVASHSMWLLLNVGLFHCLDSWMLWKSVITLAHHNDSELPGTALCWHPLWLCDIPQCHPTGMFFRQATMLVFSSVSILG